MIALAKHPLSKQLQNYSSVESITALLHEQAWAVNSKQVSKLLVNVVSVLRNAYTFQNGKRSIWDLFYGFMADVR